MEQVDIIYSELLEKVESYKLDEKYPMIEKAYKLACAAHGEQLRKSGEPYIIHPIYVAIILAELEMDVETIVAGLLHDVIEDAEYHFEDISKIFSQDVAILVDGVTKLDKIKYSSKEELQADNYRKMFLAMAKDIRVILIKVADRLHNMRTLKYMIPKKQREIAQETLDIYAPLAHRLGISKIKSELEDLSLRYIDPEAYYDLAEKIKRKQSERDAYVQTIIKDLSEKCSINNINCDIYGRPKHFFSIYRKMLNQDKTLDQIFDLFAIRVIVDTVKDCYEVLGVVHEMYKPIHNRFKDYISMPKANMYQSLHNTLIGPEGLPFEVQIRTWEMHKIAEYGLAAHWKYKCGSTGETHSEEEKLSWLRQILEWQSDMSDNKEFLDSIKTDLDAFSENVYCFSPTGEVKSLTSGSTPIDFAYSIHSAIGNKMVGARVNNKIVTFDYKLKNGDIVEVITSQNSKGPSRDWLKIVKSTNARNKINQWFKQINKEENILKGKDLIEKEIKRKGYKTQDLLFTDRINVVLSRYSFLDWDSICAAIGHGGLKEGQVANRLIEDYKKEAKKSFEYEEILKLNEEFLNNKIKQTNEKVNKQSRSGIVVNGIDDIDVRFSKCCSPVPGDEIVGFITRGRGISIHRTDCINIINLSEDERARLLESQWDSVSVSKKKEFFAEIRLVCDDKVGVIMVGVSKIIDDESISLRNINARSNKDSALIDIGVMIKDKNQLEYLIKKLRNIQGIQDIKRVIS